VPGGRSRSARCLTHVAAAVDRTAMGDDMIGSRISVLTKAGVRYEGILSKIDATQGTLTVSEGR
jgi:hypothetical protein